MIYEYKKENSGENRISSSIWEGIGYHRSASVLMVDNSCSMYPGLREPK